MQHPFEIVGDIDNVETIAVGGRIRDIMRLRKQFGSGRWRKLKGIAAVRLAKRKDPYGRGTLVRGTWDRQEENEDQEIH